VWDALPFGWGRGRVAFLGRAASFVVLKTIVNNVRLRFFLFAEIVQFAYRTTESKLIAHRQF
jgi:hypothetical protein